MEFENSELENSEFENSEFEYLEFENLEFDNSAPPRNIYFSLSKVSLISKELMLLVNKTSLTFCFNKKWYSTKLCN